MAIINSSRVEIIPPHQLQLQLLQPSLPISVGAMPPPSSTQSPRRMPTVVIEKENPFLVQSRYGNNNGTSSKAGAGPSVRIPSTDDVFYSNLSKKQNSTTTVSASTTASATTVIDGGRRPILGNRDTNNTTLTPNANATASGSTSKSLYNQRPPVPVFHTSIPKPSPVPDVFSHPLPHAHHTHLTSSYPPTNGGSTKRSAETSNDGERSKRRVLEDLRVQEQRSTRLDEQEKWRVKWLKSFPTLTFHFEMEAQQGPGKSLIARTTKMGAKVEQFFSSKVTHLIVRTVISPSKAKPPPSKHLRGSPKHPFRDPATAGSSLAQKAEQLNIKVWTLKKLSDILDRLAPIGQTSTNPHNSLSTLLEDERLHGTRERDANAPRPDWYYFRPGSKYLLVEDATAKHRTILVKEYQSQAQAAKAGLQAGTTTTGAGSGPEYPVLYETFLKITSSCESHVPVNQIRNRAIRLYVDRLPWKGEQPPGPLKRSTSLRSIPGTPSVPDTLPYQHASGNSVVLTSNIASTSTANHSPAFVNGVPALGAGRGPIMQMSKRVQVLKGNAAKMSSYGSPSDQYRPHSSTLLPPPPVPASSSSSSSTALGSKGGGKTFMTQAQVVAMLRKHRAPVEYDPEVTVERRIRNREKVDAGFRGIKEQDTSAGYCENCRLRFEDLSVHLASKKHRRFATNPDHFADLDALLKLLRRQINPHFAHDDVPFAPCWDDHTKDYPCEKCCMMIQDEEESSGGGSGVEEWGNGIQNQAQSQSPESANGSASPGTGSSPVEGEIPRDEEVEEEGGEDGVLIATEQEGEDNDDYFDESGEGKEFEE